MTVKGKLKLFELKVSLIRSCGKIPAGYYEATTELSHIFATVFQQEHSVFGWEGTTK